MKDYRNLQRNQLIFDSLHSGFEEFESSTSAPPPKKKKGYKKAPEPFTTYYDVNSEDDGDLSNQLKNRKRKRSGKKSLRFEITDGAAVAINLECPI